MPERSKSKRIYQQIGLFFERFASVAVFSKRQRFFIFAFFVKCMKYYPVIFFFLLLFSSQAQEIKAPAVKQEKEQVRYDDEGLSKEFHKSRREALRNLMPEGSVAVFFSAPVRNRANDVDYEYHQDPDFYYLTGLTEPNSVLIIFKETQKVADGNNEMVFVQPRDPKSEVWTGRRLGTDGAIRKLGLQLALENSEFLKSGIDFSKFSRVFHSKLFNDIRDNADSKGDLFDLVQHFRKNTERITPDVQGLEAMMASLREIKQPEELALMRKAITITCEAQVELMKAIEPGMKEYEAEAIVEFFFKARGAEDVGFPSILGSGENSCILHYTTNRKYFNNPDLLVSDIGAEYRGYTADVTRTIPVKGYFSPEQKIIYNIVLEAQTAGIEKCLKGKPFYTPHKAAVEVIQNRLLELGIIKEASEYRQYFMHGTSHYLGLDVHDAGLYDELKVNSVITVEPGIYIAEGSPCDPKWWNIGVRIEDDILITEGAPENLSSCVPRTVEEIEALMKEKSLFKQIRK